MWHKAKDKRCGCDEPVVIWYEVKRFGKWWNPFSWMKKVVVNRYGNGWSCQSLPPELWGAL
jgi:hypothetical protein